LGDISRKSYKTYISINSQLNASPDPQNWPFFVLSFNKNMWGMFHVCLLSVVLFQSLILGLAVKLKVEPQTAEEEN